MQPVHLTDRQFAGLMNSSLTGSGSMSSSLIGSSTLYPEEQTPDDVRVARIAISESADHVVTGRSKQVNFAAKPTLSFNQDKTKDLFFSHLGSLEKMTELDGLLLDAFDVLKNKTEKFTSFNAVVDRIKQDRRWEKSLELKIRGLPYDQLLWIATQKPYDLRGYDREFLFKSLKVINDMRLDGSLNLTTADAKHLEEMTSFFDTLILNVDPSKMKVIGGGAVNTVYSVDHVDPKTGKVTTSIFKPDSADLNAYTTYKEKYFGTAAASGIPVGLDAHLASRSVASSKVDQWLYGENNVSVKTQYVIVNGKRGILMEKAAGKSPKITGFKEKPVNMQLYPQISYLIENLWKINKGCLTPQDLKLLAELLKVRSLRIEHIDENNWVLMGTTPTFEHFNPKNVRTAKDLLALQLKDIITGECDRHPGNYFVDEDGKVTGIDEDCCFGVNAIPEGDVRNQPKLMGLIPNNASLMLRMPDVVTQDLKEKINRLYENRSELHEILGPYVSDEEIAAAEVRLTKLYRHINSGVCLVVEQDSDLLSKKTVEKVNSDNSYWARELMVFSNNQTGWNYLREPRTLLAILPFVALLFATLRKEKE